MIHLIKSLIARRKAKAARKEEAEYKAFVRAKAFAVALGNTIEGGWLKP